MRTVPVKFWEHFITISQATVESSRGCLALVTFGFPSQLRKHGCSKPWIWCTGLQGLTWLLKFSECINVIERLDSKGQVKSLSGI